MYRVLLSNSVHKNPQSDTMLCRPTLQFPQRRLIELLYNIQRLVLHHLLVVIVVLVVDISDTAGHTVCGAHQLAYVDLPSSTIMTLVSAEASPA